MLKFLTFSAALLGAVLPQAVRADDRALVESFYSQVVNAAGSADLAQRVERVLAPNWESVGDYTGRNKSRAEFVAQLGNFAMILPDLRWEVVEILRDGDRYVVRGRARATPVRNFFGVEPSGKGFDIMSIDIHTVSDGRIVQSHHIEDWAAALRQLRVPTQSGR